MGCDSNCRGKAWEEKMTRIQFWVRLLWMMAAMVFNLKAVERYVTFRKARWAKPLAFAAYWGVAGTIIFVGDWGNLPVFHSGIFYRDASGKRRRYFKNRDGLCDVFQFDVCL